MTEARPRTYAELIARRKDEFVQKTKANSENVKYRYDSREPSYLVQKQQTRKNLSEKITNVPLSTNDGRVFEKIPLWNADYYINERSQIDDPNKPMYSSFSADKVFDPSRKHKNKMVPPHKYKYSTDWTEFNAAEYLHKPLAMPVTPGKEVVIKTITSQNSPMIDSRHPYDKDYEDFSDSISTSSHMSRSSSHSTITTVTVVSTVSKGSSASTPRTWAIQKPKPQNPLSQSIQSIKPVSASVSLRPQSATRSRAPSIPVPYTARPLSARPALVNGNNFESRQKEADPVTSRSSNSEYSVSSTVPVVETDVYSYKKEAVKPSTPKNIKKLDMKSVAAVQKAQAPKSPHNNSYSSVLTRVTKKDINTVTTKPFRAHSPVKVASPVPSFSEPNLSIFIEPQQQQPPIPVKRPMSASTSRIKVVQPMQTINTARNHREIQRSQSPTNSRPTSATNGKK